MKSRSVKRREFLAGVAAFSLLGAKGNMDAKFEDSGNDPSDHAEAPIRLGIIGLGNRGEELYRELLQSTLNIEILALCEIFDQRLRRGLQAAGGKTRSYHNYLDLLDDEDIDAVVIATPDHWHAQMARDAAGRGKHIYLETSMTRTLDEAKALRDAVKNTGVIFQLGFQGSQRDLNLKARELIASDILGKITLIETTTNRNDPDGGWKAGEDELATGESIDWELFEKPLAVKHPFSPERYYGWRNYWEYGNGMSGDLLSNELNMVNMVLDPGIPKSAMASGGLYYHRDGRQVPDVFHAVFDYPDQGLCLLYSGTLANGIPRGTLFMGRDASLELGRILSVWADKSSVRYKSRIRAGIIDPAAPFVNYMQDENRVDGISSATAKYYADRGLVKTYREGKQVSTTGLHLAEWLACIRSGRECSCNIEQGFKVAVSSLMAARSFLEGRKVEWDPREEVII